jgi:hypothetical protein
MTKKMIERDTTIEEIHCERRRIAEKFGGDIAAILEDARIRQKASGRAIWQGPLMNNALAREASAGRREDFEKYLAAIPDVAPPENDRID